MKWEKGKKYGFMEKDVNVEKKISTICEIELKNFYWFVIKCFLISYSHFSYLPLQEQYLLSKNTQNRTKKIPKFWLWRKNFWAVRHLFVNGLWSIVNEPNSKVFKNTGGEDFKSLKIYWLLSTYLYVWIIHCKVKYNYRYR